MAKKYLSPDGLAYFWDQIKTRLGQITTDLGRLSGTVSGHTTTLENHSTRISAAETWEELHRVIKVDVGSFSSLPKTVTDSRIKSSDVCIEAVISNPSAQTSDWTITTAAGSLTISGSISGSTSVTLFLTVPE